jgi:predicted CXXCH cytochrome family protein
MRKYLRLFLLGTAALCVSETAAQTDIERYTGSSACITCHSALHPEIVDNWRTSVHAATMQSVSTDSAVVALIGRTDSTQVKINHAHQVQNSPNQTLRVHFTPHNEINNNHAPAKASERCYGCHATGYNTSTKSYVEPGIGCEACHGPGVQHVQAQGVDDTIINPANLSDVRKRMICGQCHSLGQDPSGRHPFPVLPGGAPFQPGTDLSAAFIDSQPVTADQGGEYSTLVGSLQPYSDQQCTDCHAPHGSTGKQSMLIDDTSSLCLRCHGDILSGIVQVHPGQHWGSSEQPCWTCHEYTHLH